MRRRPHRTILLLALALAAGARPGLAQSPAEPAGAQSPAQPASAQSPAQPAPAAPSADEIFRKAFGNKPKAKPAAAAPRRLEVPLLVGAREIAAVPARLGPGPAEAAVALEPLLAALEPLIRPDLVERLRAAPAAEGFAPLAALAAEGLDFAFDPAEIAIRVTLAPASRRTVALDLLGGRRAPSGNVAVAPAAVSAVTNLNAGIEWSNPSGGTGGGPAGRQPLRIVLDHALNIDGTVLEAETFYREDSATPWQRGDLRLTRDWPEARLRAVAGDLVVPAVGFQGSRSVGGLAVARNFQLDPGTPYQPAGQQDFTLTDAATVEVLVNGRPARTYRLGPGPYSLRNFPGTLGANDVTIRIVDEFGRTQTISVPFFFDAQLLGEGVHEFAYAAGIASGIDRGVYRYDEGRLTASAWHRYGVSERLTLGLNLQGDRERRLLGAEALLATPYGTFGLEPALSDGGGIDPDYAARLTYRDFRSGEAVWQRRTLTAAATWRGPGFAPLGTVQPRNPVRLDLAARVSQPLLDWLSFGLGGRYQVSRDPEAGDTANAELLLRARLAPGASFDVSVERNRLADGGSETALFAGLRFALDGGRQTVGASYAARDRDAQLDWRYRGGEPVDRLEGGLQLGRDRFGRRIEGDAAFTGQRLVAQARSSYLDRLEEAGGRSRDRRTALSLGTALLYADGRFAVSRPVGDSFAIVEPHPRLEGRLIGVDPFGGAYLARSDALGAPVVPDLTGYRARSLLLDVPEAPANYDLGNDRPVVTPTYRSGTVVPIGTDATASLAGLLRDAEGKPLALRSGVLTPRAGGEGIAFFSNRQGRFRIEGVRPGAWVLTLHGDEGRPLPVEVPATAEGTLDLGILTPGEARP